MLLILAATVMALTGNLPGSAERRARNALAVTLHDPDSALFRNLTVDSVGKVCGEVNAKNLYGAYVGYRHFYAWDGIVQIDDGDATQDAERLCK